MQNLSFIKFQLCTIIPNFSNFADLYIGYFYDFRIESIPPEDLYPNLVNFRYGNCKKYQAGENYNSHYQEDTAYEYNECQTNWYNSVIRENYDFLNKFTTHYATIQKQTRKAMTDNKFKEKEMRPALTRTSYMQESRPATQKLKWRREKGRRRTNLGGEVLEDSGEEDRSAGAHAVRALALLEEAGDPPDGENKPRLAAPRLPLLWRQRERRTAAALPVAEMGSAEERMETGGGR